MQYQMGRYDVLGEYPIHFHNVHYLGLRSSVTGSTLYNTYNRCITIHCTDGLLVSSNTCYNHIGATQKTLVNKLDKSCLL